MAKFDKKIEALKLRRQGISIITIAHNLCVSKSSVSHWCCDIELTEEQRERLRKNKGRILGAETNRRKKQECINFFVSQGIEEIGKLSKRDLLIAGISLYWGEGSKKSRMSLINSDPALILFMKRWFEEVMDVKKEEFMPRIFISEIHKPRAEKILNYWTRLLNLPDNQFGKIVFLKNRPKKIYENYDNYFGVLALGTRNSAKLKYRILGLIEALKKPA